MNWGIDAPSKNGIKNNESGIMLTNNEIKDIKVINSLENRGIL